MSIQKTHATPGLWNMYMWISRANLCTGSERLVLMELCATANVAQQYTCYPSFRTIAEMTGLSAHTCRNAVVSLEAKQLLKRESRRSTSNRYWINWQLIQKRGEEAIAARKQQKVETLLAPPGYEVEMRRDEIESVSAEDDADHFDRRTVDSLEIDNHTALVSAPATTSQDLTRMDDASSSAAIDRSKAPAKAKPSTAPVPGIEAAQIIEGPIYPASSWKEWLCKARGGAPTEIAAPWDRHQELISFIREVAPDLCCGSAIHDGTPQVRLYERPIPLASRLLSSPDRPIRFTMIPPALQPADEWLLSSAIQTLANDSNPITQKIRGAKNPAAYLFRSLPDLVARAEAYWAEQAERGASEQGQPDAADSTDQEPYPDDDYYRDDEPGEYDPVIEDPVDR